MEELRNTIEAMEDQKRFINEHIDDLDDMINQGYVKAEFTTDYQNEIRECNQTIREINQKEATLKEALRILEEEN